jgi:hypothetical protein
MNSIPYCIHERINEDKKGKVCTYFTFKEHFIREKYTFLNDFKVRQAICKIRISAHPLMIQIAYIDYCHWRQLYIYI